jgi:acyl-CoA synthetase (AMP-forming)/AMP-acid ligase II
VLLDSLPRNPTGKVLKRELAEMENGAEDKKDKGRKKAKAR